MALIKCPECGKEISDKAGKCPNCGCPTGRQIDQNVIFQSKEQEAKSSIGKNIFIGASLVFFLGCLLIFVYAFLSSSTSTEEDRIPYAKSTENIVEENSSVADNSSSNITAGQRNALKSAKSYLSYSAFSREGLIHQLEFEKYTREEAEYGADNCGADWKEQAVKSARSYFEFSAFSRKGMIKQLEFEKYTKDEAEYGADNCGADWKEQAAKSAESYLEFSSFSKDGLIKQLEFEGYTEEEAVYGAEANGF